MIKRQSNEDEQWEINEKILLDSFEEEEEEFINEAIKEIFDYDVSEQLKDFLNSLDDEGMHNLENATEAMEVDFKKMKRARYGESSVKMKERWKDHLEYLKIGLRKKTIIHTIIYQVNMHTWEQKKRI
jgi:hypothetical protein